MKKFLLIFGLLICACDTPAQREADQKAEQQARDLSNLNDIRYYKDTRTDLCFSGAWVGAKWGLWANVPCTPEVEESALKFASPK